MYGLLNGINETCIPICISHCIQNSFEIKSKRADVGIRTMEIADICVLLFRSIEMQSAFN